jgi:cell division protein FtsL
MTTTMHPTRRKREQLKRLGWLTEAQAALGWGIILILAALLGAIYLNQASRIASVGRRVQVLQNELESLKRENADLSRQLAESQSLERLQREAIRLGFIPARPDDIEYIIVPDYPVSNGEPASSFIETPPVISTPAPPETMSEAAWLAFKASVGNLIYGEASEQ